MKPDTASRDEAAYLYAALEQVEIALAGLYAWFAERFAGDDEAVDLFRKMHSEELRHVEWVRERHARAERGEQDRPPFEDSDVDAVLTAIEQFQENHPKPDLTTAILFVLELEHTTAEAHRRIAERNGDGETNPLIASLSAADDRHVLDLTHFAVGRGIRAFGA